jgi:hypothetical protein
MPTTPPVDDLDLLDRLDAGLPPRSPEEAAARVPYERLIARIRELEDVKPLPGWEERAMARWRAERDRSTPAPRSGVTSCCTMANTRHDRQISKRSSSA